MTMKMKTSHLLLALVATAAFSITSCEMKEGCTDPNAINYDAEVELDNGSCVYQQGEPKLSLHFHSKLGDAAFAYNTEVTNWEGRKMSFTIAQFYVSGIALAGAPFPERYLLVTPDSQHHEIGLIELGSYQDLTFHVGVDSAANHLDPATWPSGHALSSNNPNHAHWGWDPGFIFIKVEGLVDTTADKSGEANAPFLFHIGLDELLQTVELDLEFTVEGDRMIGIQVDWLKFFDNIDLRADRATHTTNDMPLATAFSGNVAGAFSVE